MALEVSSAAAVSGDGRVVVGQSWADPGEYQAFRWEDGVIEGLGFLSGTPTGGSESARAITDDGTVIIGEGGVNGGKQGFRWENGVMTPLPDLAGGFTSGGASGISPDGYMIVGHGNNSNEDFEAVRWIGSGVAPLGDLDAGVFSSNAADASIFGSVIVGRGNSFSGTEAARWEGGLVQRLGDLPGGNFQSVANAVTPDGLVIVGQGTTDHGQEAIRWEAGVMTGLGSLPGGNFTSTANDVTPDGDIIVGSGNIAAGNTPMVWDPVNGMRGLRMLMTDKLGLNLNGWELITATGISNDGRVIVGNAFNPDGHFEGWRVDLGRDAKWNSNTSGDWDDRSRWGALGLYLPDPLDDVEIRPTGNVVVQGPTTSAAVKTLAVGAPVVGTAELRLTQGNDLNVYDGIDIEDGGRLSGVGVINATIDLQPGGEINLQPGDDLLLHTGLTIPAGAAVRLVGGELTLDTPSTFINDEHAWTGIAQNIEALDTTADNTALADEVVAPLSNNFDLGPILTFDAANTGLARSFTVETLQPNAKFTFNDHEGSSFSPLPGFKNTYSVGDTNNYEDDDFQITINSGPDLHAFGFALADNLIDPGESLTFYGPGDQLLGTSTVIPGFGVYRSAFMGILSSIPITRIVFDESPGFDDIAIADFYFGTLPSFANVNLPGGNLFLDGGTLNAPAGLTNQGLITAEGFSHINAPLTNAAGAQIRVQEGAHLVLGGSSTTNAGTINLFGGTLESQQPLTLTSTGRLNGRGTLFMNAGLTNQGNINFSGGFSDVFGDVTLSNRVGRVTAAAGAIVSFYDIVTHNGDDIHASASSEIVFFGLVNGEGNFGGEGVIDFQGGYDPGNSPANISFGGDVSFGPFGGVTIELAGLDPSLPDPEHDQLNVAGNATLAGTLDIEVIDSFDTDIVPFDAFTVITWGTNNGDTEFDTVNFTPPATIPGVSFDINYNEFDLSIEATALGGDANLDGTVDLTDLTILAINFETPESDRRWRKADFNNDNKTDLTDLTILAINFGAMISGGSVIPGAGAEVSTLAAAVGLNLNQVPEPTTLAILSLTTLAALTRRRSGSK